MLKRITLFLGALVCACALTSCSMVSDLLGVDFSQGSSTNQSTEIPAAAENNDATEEMPVADTDKGAAEDQEDGGNTVSDNNTNPIVTIEMENGDIIKLELYPDKAPNTVANFVTLAKDGFYDGVIFHRVIYGFMIQGGDPDGIGTGGPGYNIKGEMYNNGNKLNDIKHEPGVISMARSRSYDSAGSQFFIMHMDAPHLDNEYCAFGRVIEGMDVVNRIAETPTAGSQGSTPTTPVVMKTVTVDDKGVEYKVVKN